MKVLWTTAFLDSGPDAHEARTAFWRQVTGARISAARGADGEFTTLLPPEGDAFLRAQRLAGGPVGVHLDLHTDDVSAGADAAAALGATVVADHGYAVLSSPGGLAFCIVGWHGETRRPAPIGEPAELVDQVCIDVPAESFEREVAFWTALTGWEARAASAPEFTVLVRAPGMPLRFLLQRLGIDDARTRASAHLDIACGADVHAVVARHVAAGAREVMAGPNWTVMADPGEAVYCLTRRDPATGLLSH